jgi:hypothetical protein
MSEKVFQEMYCTISGGGCGKYFTVKLNLAINQTVIMVCPNCGHEHQRCIENGVIKERGRFNNKVTEHIIAPKSSISDVPLTQQMKKAAGGCNERDGVVITDATPLVGRSAEADAIVRESWFSRFGGRR